MHEKGKLCFRTDWSEESWSDRERAFLFGQGRPSASFRQEMFAACKTFGQFGEWIKIKR